MSLSCSVTGFTVVYPRQNLVEGLKVVFIVTIQVASAYITSLRGFLFNQRYFPKISDFFLLFHKICILYINYLNVDLMPIKVLQVPVRSNPTAKFLHFPLKLIFKDISHSLALIILV